MFDSRARFFVILSLVVALAAAFPPGAAAQGPTASLGALLKASVRGVAADQVRVSKLESGLTKVVVPLAAARDSGAEFVARRAKPLTMLCLTHELFEPDLFAETVSFDFAPIDDFPYYYGWVVLNDSDEDLQRKTTVTRKGPGPDIRRVEQLVYDAGSFVLFFFEDPGAAPGVHKFQVKVATAKKLFTNICSGCAG